MKILCIKTVHNENGAVMYEKGSVYEINTETKLVVNSLGELDSFWKEHPDKFIQYFKVVEETQKDCDAVNHPRHYTSHPSGIECIEIAKYYNFCIGNAFKYLWRCGLKSEEGMTTTHKSIQDLEKAIWYIKQEIINLTPKERAVCLECGGHNVEIAAWVNPNNNNEYCSDYGDSFTGYCNDCEKEVSIDYECV